MSVVGIFRGPLLGAPSLESYISLSSLNILTNYICIDVLAGIEGERLGVYVVIGFVVVVCLFIGLLVIVICLYVHVLCLLLAGIEGERLGVRARVMLSFR